MKHLFSLVHLTNIHCPPPQLVYTAAKAGYDAVSIRTIPLGLAGEKPYDLAHDKAHGYAFGVRAGVRPPYSHGDARN